MSIGSLSHDINGNAYSVVVGNGYVVRVGDRVAWAGHDGCNKTSGIRMGKVREIRENSDMLVWVEYSSAGAVHARNHVIKSSELKKAVRAW